MPHTHIITRKWCWATYQLMVALLNYNEHEPTTEFLDSLASNSFITYILQPTRITSH